MTDNIIDRGEVTEIQGNRARVRIETGEACKSCGARILCAPGSGKDNTLLADNLAGAKIGDRVAVEEGQNLLLKLSAIQYGIPLIGFIFGIAVTYLIPSLRDSELVLFAGGLLGIAMGGTLSWIKFRKMSRNTAGFFQVTRIIKN